MFHFLRLTTKFLAVLRLTVNPIETLVTDIRDFTALFYVILRRETSGRFIKTENIKCGVCIIIVTSRKASVTTKRTPVWQFR